MPGLFDGTSLERPVTCEYCAQASCVCPKDASGLACPPRVQSVRVRREKRRGKWNTVLSGVRASHEPGSADLRPLLKHLRTSLGTGGGLSDTKVGDAGEQEIVLQGDHRDTVVGRLRELGYEAKASGG